MNSSIEKKRDELLSAIHSYGRVAVAFSGGVDSAVVAKAAFDVWGADAVAVTAVSPSLATGEFELAQSVAAQIGIRHFTIVTEEFATEGYRRNAGDRCFYCKSELYAQISSRLDEFGVSVICNGTNQDDLGDYRPGLQAAADFHVRSPLVDAHCTKSDVRALAHFWELPVWDKPAAPCLSSRIAYGLEVTPERVERVNLAESYLQDILQIRELRVRHEANDLARIEVPLESLTAISGTDVREQVIHKLRKLGFKYVTIDLEGFRSGSMNASLPMIQLDGSL